MPITMFLTTSDIMRPDQNSCFSLDGAERPTMDSTNPCPIRRLCRLPTLHEPRRWSAGPQTEGEYEHACSSRSKKKPAEE
jgi:hypothetical protein